MKQVNRVPEKSYGILRRTGVGSAIDKAVERVRRLGCDSLDRLVQTSSWSLLHLTGFTFPISNMLLPVSNFLVARSEKHKLVYSALERTRPSGKRTVKYKTYFPSILAILPNPVTLFPLHVIQKLLRKSPRALVLYFEAKPDHQGARS